MFNPTPPQRHAGVLLAGALSLTSALTQAASLSATVTDAATEQPLANAELVLSHWLPDQARWRVLGRAIADDGGEARFTALETGTYSLQTFGPFGATSSYDAEYYDDTRDEALKTELSLFEDEHQVLSPIALSTKPIHLRALRLTPVTLPSAGGTVSLSGQVVSSKAAAETISYWVNLSVYDPAFDARAEATLREPGKLRLPPGTTPFTLALDIPATVPDGRCYTFDLTLGASPLQPIVNGRFGEVCKGLEQPAQ